MAGYRWCSSTYSSAGTVGIKVRIAFGKYDIYYESNFAGIDCEKYGI